MDGCRLSNPLNTALDSIRRKISTETETIKKAELAIKTKYGELHACDGALIT